MQQPPSPGRCPLHMSTPTPAADSDPRPQPPEKPLPQECCESGCPICVYDLYAEALEEYRRALAAWESRQADRSQPL
jgi:hypothetical protein